MRTHCPANERIKREYLTYLKEAQRYSEPSLDGIAKAIARFEAYTRYADFKKYHVQQAVGFKHKLASASNSVTGKPLSLATQRSALSALKAFFKWLAASPVINRGLHTQMPIISTYRTRIIASHRQTHRVHSPP